MSLLRSWLARLRHLVGRVDPHERELAEELESHLQLHIDDNIRAGMTPAEARRHALVRLGGIEGIKEEHRDQRGVPVVATLVQDTRFGLRLLGRSPVFALVAIGSLALGLGAHAAVFSVLNALYLKPLPASAPEQLVNVATASRTISYDDFERYRAENGVFTDMAALAPVYVADSADARELDGYLVSSHFFPVMGIEPALGRFFESDEDRPGQAAPAVVLGQTFWQARFGGDPDVIGRTVVLSGTPFTIIGVCPSRFPAPGFGETAVETWLPMGMAGVLRARSSLQMVGRLEPGQTQSTAAATLAGVAARLDQDDAVAGGEPRRLEVWPASGMPPYYRGGQFPIVLFAGVSALLLIACVNLAGLQLARGLARADEMAVRRALGASRWRLVRQMGTESLLLALLAVGPGILMAQALSRLLARFYLVEVEGQVPFLDFSLDTRVLAYTFGLAALTGLAFGIVPALQAWRAPVADRLRQGRGGSRVRHLWPRDILLGVQVAVSVVLLASAGLLARSATNALGHPGFETGSIAFLRMKPRLIQYDAAASERYFRDVTDTLEAVPGVRAVAFAAYPTFPTWCCEDPITVQPETAGTDPEVVNAMWNAVTPSFFETLDIPVVTGRGFTDADRQSERRVAVVNEALARRLRPGGNVIGTTLTLEETSYDIVGIVDYDNFARTDGQRRLFMFIAARETPNRLFVRVDGDPRTMLPALRAAIVKTDPAVPISEELPLSEMLGSIFYQVRVGSAILLFAGGLALVLCAMGVYGLLSCLVQERRREIGIRLALGAGQGRIARSVLRRGLITVALGALAGMLATPAGVSLLSAHLYGVPATDWVSILGAPALLGLVTAIIAAGPAFRASRFDPSEAARSD